MSKSVGNTDPPRGRGKARLTTDDFIKRARQKHGDFYDYSETIFSTSHEPVVVICPVHGRFVQKAYQHLNHGCRHCSNARASAKRVTSLEEFISRAMSKHGSRYDYSHVRFSRQHDQIEIACPKHGVFKQIANDHLKGHGCRVCANEQHAAARRGKLVLTADEISRRGKQVHGDAYRYEKVIYRGPLVKITITCPQHGDFEQLANNHLAGYGCTKCAAENLRQPFHEFERRSRERHGDRYDYASYTAIDEPVGIVCSEHGLFYQRGSDHIKGSGCPACARNQRAELIRLPVGDFVERIRDRFGSLLDFDSNHYIDLATPIEFVCGIHGSSVEAPEAVLSRKHPCVKCANEARAVALAHDQSSFEARARSVHGGKYEYGTYSARNKIEITCPTHGPFVQDPGNHLAGYGCPSCGHKRREMQNAWLDTLGVAAREVVITAGSQRFVVDGFDIATNTVFEFWGDFWHGNPSVYDGSRINSVVGKTFGELLYATHRKRQAILDAGYLLVEIWESDWLQHGKKDG